MTLSDASSDGASSTGQLQGQTQALADGSGLISITDLVLVAIPGVHSILVALPNFPEVNETPPLSQPSAYTLGTHPFLAFLSGSQYRCTLPHAFQSYSD